MNIYISHSNGFNFKDKLYVPLKESGLFGEHIFFLPHDEERNQNTKQIIKNSDLMIAETSFPSTGSGIEMGWANAFGVPIWCLYKEGSKPSSSTKYISEKDLSYTDSQDMITVLEKYLSKNHL